MSICPCDETEKVRSSLVSGRSDALVTQAVRYMIVGAIATVVDISILRLFIQAFGMSYLAAAAPAFILGVVVGYVLSVHWVFSSRRMGNRTVEFLVFTVIGLVGLGLTELILYTGVEIIHLHYVTAKLVAVVLVFNWNFGVRRILLFKGRDSELGKS